MAKKAIYQTSNINLVRNDRKVLTDVSITLCEGELTALIGPNSAGKSTLLQVMLGLLKHDSGDICLQKKILSAWSHNHLAKMVAYLPQQHKAHWPISVYDYVALGRIPYSRFGQGLSTEDHQQIQWVVEKTDIRHLLSRPVTNLSGGELCRVAIARTLAVDADVLLIDEPIAGLDPSHQLSIMQLLKNEAKSGKTVLTVIHDLTLAGRYCDSIYLLDAGKMVCSGTPEAVLTDHNLRDVYQVTSKVIQSSPVKVIMPWERIDG